MSRPKRHRKILAKFHGLSLRAARFLRPLFPHPHVMVRNRLTVPNTLDLLLVCRSEDRTPRDSSRPSGIGHFDTMPGSEAASNRIRPQAVSQPAPLPHCWKTSSHCEAQLRKVCMSQCQASVGAEAAGPPVQSLMPERLCKPLPPSRPHGKGLAPKPSFPGVSPSFSFQKRQQLVDGFGLG